MSDSEFLDKLDFDPNSLFAEGGQRKVVKAILRRDNTEYVVKMVNEEGSIVWDSDSSDSEKKEDEQCERSQDSKDLSLETRLKYVSLVHELNLSKHPNITLTEFASPTYTAELFRDQGNLTEYISNTTKVPTLLERLRICLGLSLIHI